MSFHVLTIKFRWIFYLIFAGIIIYFLPVILFILYMIAQPFIAERVLYSASFDQTIWIEMASKNDGSTCYRGRMLYDIINNHLEKGMTRESVKQLLGEPDEVTVSSDEYYVGFCTYIDMDGLLVKYTDGRLSEALRVQH